MPQQPGDSHQRKIVTFDPNPSSKVVFFVVGNKPKRDRKGGDREAFKQDSEDFTRMLEEPWC